MEVWEVTGHEQEIGVSQFHSFFHLNRSVCQYRCTPFHVSRFGTIGPVALLFKDGPVSYRGVETGIFKIQYQEVA